MFFKKILFYSLSFTTLCCYSSSKATLSDHEVLSQDYSAKKYSVAKPFNLLNTIKNYQPPKAWHASHDNFVYQSTNWADPSYTENLRNIVPYIQNAARYDFPKNHQEMDRQFEIYKKIHDQSNPTNVEKAQVSKQFNLDTFNFIRSFIEDPMKLDFLRQIFPQGYITSEEWSQAGQTLQKIKDNAHIAYYHENEVPVFSVKEKTIREYFKSSEFFQDLKQTAAKIDQIVQPGDTIIGVGNTPQYVIKALQLNAKEKFNYISVALSGWPGRPKTCEFLNNVVTEQGLENYRIYLQSLGLDGTKPHQRFWFLDIVSGGGGIEFLTHQLRQAYDTQGQPCPEMKVIALNDIGEQFKGQTLSLEAISLNQGALSQQLDRMPSNMRITPDFSAWRWHFVDIVNSSELKDKLSLQDVVATTGSGEYAQELQDLMAHHFNHKILTGYNWHLLSTNVPEGIEAEVWVARLGFYQSKPYEIRQFFNTRFDLVDLYGHQNNQNFYEWMNQFSLNDESYQQNVAHWESFKKTHQRANNPVWHQTNDANTLGLLMHLQWSSQNNQV